MEKHSGASRNLKINANEIRITELKAKMNKPGEILDPLYSKKITTLEQQNKDLRAKLFAYEKSLSDLGII